MIQYFISPNFQGSLTARDLLSTEGSFVFAAERAFFNNDLDLFFLKDISGGKYFHFSLRIQGQAIIFKKNEGEVNLDINPFPGRSIYVTAVWKPNELTIFLSTSFKKEIVTAKTQINYCVPPPSTIRWARKENLLPLDQYDSEEEFRQKVHSCLLSIQDKINESGSFSQFWNVSYNGSKIVSRFPKKEIEVQPIIHSLLSDQFLMSSIEIVPEYHCGIGNLDFLFISKLKDGGFSYFCAEFKNLHSEKLEQGLHAQLPAYMAAKNSSYGAYCVLDYRGKYFEKPENIEENIELYLNKKLMESGAKPNPNIRVFQYSLSNPKSASKL